jgi:signal transduction histidine kinase
VTRLLLVLWSALAAAVAVAAVVVARSGDNAETTYAGTTWAASLWTLGAALALFVTAPFARSRAGAVLAVCAGVCWLAPILVSWATAPGTVRATAVIAAAFVFPLLAHLALAAPTGSLEGRAARGVVAAAYAWAGVSAGLLALVRDPFYDVYCWSDCSGNAFLVRSWPELADALVSARPWAALSLGAAVFALAVRRLAAPSVVERIAGTAAALVGAAAVAHALAVLSTPLEDPLDRTFRGVFLLSCAAAGLVALALVAPRVERALRRHAVSRVVRALDEAPAPDELERTLAQALRDPTLRLVFRLPELGRCVDAAGSECPSPAAADGRGLTPLVRDDEPVAWIDHDAGVGEAVEPALTPAVRLSIDNARLRAELLAQMRDLRDARRRIVSDGDDERRRLERDLHDSVQQQLLALAASLRSGAGLARASGDGATAVLDAAVDETAVVLEAVRVLAHGIYPAVLTDAGLGPAVASLADVAGLPVKILHAPAGRYPATVEAAAYHVVAESVENAVAYSDATIVTVEISEADGRLELDIHDDGRGGAEVQAFGGLAELVDRVGAIDGRLSVSSSPESGTTISAVLPCAS